MGAGTFTFDEQHIFEGKAVYTKLEELDGQRRLDFHWKCENCGQVFFSSEFAPEADCPECNSADSLVQSDVYVRPGVLMSIGHYLRGWDNVTMLVEDDVVDEEYFREFLYFYSATYWEYPVRTHRLHFFSKPWSEIEKMFRPEDYPPNKIDDHLYLGYVMLRPTVPQTVGETLLAHPQETDKETCHVTCSTGFGQTVAGHRLRIDCAPMIGQDQTGVCAHSTLWGALKYLHKYRYYPKMSMPELAIRAGELDPTTKFRRPTGGLLPEVIYALLQDLGFNVHYEAGRGDEEGRFPILRTIYSGVESGLPVLLHLDCGPGGVSPPHAAWIVGHTLGHWADEGSERETYKGHFVTLRNPVHRWLVNDDNVGPYMPATIERVTAKDPKADPQVFLNLRYDGYRPKANTDPLCSPRRIRQIVGAFVPLPEEVFIGPSEVEAMTKGVFTDDYLLGLMDYIPDDVQQKSSLVKRLQNFAHKIENDNTELRYRTYLVMSDRYREYVARSGMHTALKKLYTASFAFPEYIWVSEIIDAKYSTVSESGEASVIGEVVLDSTDSLAFTAGGGIRWLALHIPGLLLYAHGIAIPVDLSPHEKRKRAFHALLLPEDEEPYGCFTSKREPPDPPRSYRKLGPMW